MDDLYRELNEAVAALRTRGEFEPRIGAVLGSGLGSLVDQLVEPVAVPYGDIPHFPGSTVAGHAGRLVFGSLHGAQVVMMEGRPHYYEGHSMRRIGFPMYLLKFLGVDTLIITNACGGVNPDFAPGTLMIIEDFINMVSRNPLIGPNDERIGPRFPDMSEPYRHRLIALAERIAAEEGIACAKGVYAGFPGPYFETAAEIRAVGRLGADAVGMSTVPETIAANYVGMDCLGIACVTNMATGIQKEKHSHQRVLETAKAASEDLGRWISSVIRAL